MTLVCSLFYAGAKKCVPCTYILVGRVAQRLAAGWTVRGSNPVGGEIFRTCPDQPWGPPSLLYNGYLVFPGGKERPGCDADPSLPSSAVGHERVEIYFYSPLWAVRPVQSLSACTRVTFTFTFTYFLNRISPQDILYPCSSVFSSTILIGSIFLW